MEAPHAALLFVSHSHTCPHPPVHTHQPVECLDEVVPDGAAEASVGELRDHVAICALQYLLRGGGRKRMLDEKGRCEGRG